MLQICRYPLTGYRTTQSVKWVNGRQVAVCRAVWRIRCAYRRAVFRRRTRPASWFRFCSTQQASNLHDHSTSFPKWADGDRSDAVRNELRESLGKFVSKKHAGKFPRLEQLTKASDEFEKFWNCIDWRLGG